MTQVKLWWPAALAAASVLAGCVGAPPVEALTLEQPALWHQKEAGMSQVDGVAMRHGRVVVAGGNDARSRLVVLDADTGQTQWSLDQDQEIFGGDGELAFGEGFPSAIVGGNGEPVITGKGEDWKIVIPYWRERGEKVEFGVAALDGDSGTAAWSKPLKDADAKLAAGHDLPTPFAATADTIILRPWVDNAKLDLPVSALDAGSGKRLWQRKLEGWPYLVDGGTLLGDAAEEFSEGRPSTDGTTTAMAWNARTGEPALDLAGEGASSHVQAVADGIAVIGVGEDDWDVGKNIAIDLSTGDEIAELGDAITCTTDGRTAIVCDSTDRMYTMTTSDREVVAGHAGTDDPNFRVVGAHRDQVFVEVGPDAENVDIVDTSGEIVARDAPGRPAAVSSDRAVFVQGDQPYGMTQVALYGIAS